MATRFIPFVLNDQTEVDGEKAFLLAAYSMEPGEPAVSPVAPLKFRTSRMKAQILWQIETLKFGLLLIVRSPFASQALNAGPVQVPIAGAMQAAPAITFTPYGATDATLNFNVAWSDSQDPAAATPVDWPITGALPLPAPGFFETFNGKAIPNWAILIDWGTPPGSAPAQILFTIDFSHSIT